MHRCPRCNEGTVRPEKVSDLRLRRVVVTQNVCVDCAAQQMEEIESADQSWVDKERELEDREKRENE